MRAELGNRVVDIPDTQIDYYASKGYTIFDDNNNIVGDKEETTVPLEKYEEALKKIAELEAEIAKLKKAKKETPKAETPKVEEPKEEVKAEEQPAPKKTTTKKK